MDLTKEANTNGLEKTSRQNKNILLPGGMGCFVVNVDLPTILILTTSQPFVTAATMQFPMDKSCVGYVISKSLVKIVEGFVEFTELP
jgi:hypothetical protein